MLTRPIIRLVGAFLSAVPALSAQALPTVEERLRALEQQVLSLAKENRDLKQQLGWKGEASPIVPQPGGKESKLVVGGFLQAQGEFGRAADARWNGVKDRFFFRRARIYLAGTVAQDFDFKAELDLQGNSLSAGTGLNARANEIFINWHKCDFANVRFGQLKPAYGAEALLSDAKMFTVERSLASDRLVDVRQLAAALAGDLFRKKASYLIVVANGNGANVSANDNSKFQKSARFTFTPLAAANHRLTLGVDGLWADDTALAKPDLGFAGNLFAGRRSMAGLDAQWTIGPLDLSAEWLCGTFRPVGAVPAAEFKTEGWHVTAACFLIPSTLQAVIREQAFDPNTSVGGNTVTTTTLGLNYFLKGDDLKLMLDYLKGRGPGSTMDGGRLLARFQIVY